MLELRKSSNTTESSGRQTTEFGPWNVGIVHWRKRKREATTSRVEEFLTLHGSTRLCCGLIQYKTRIRFTCAKCGAEMRSRWSDLLPRTRVWCRSCLKKELMRGKLPSWVMLERAAQTNREGAARQRQLRRITPAPVVPMTRETTRSQVKRLSKGWPPSDWAEAMTAAQRAFQRCTNPNASSYAYYGGRGVVFGFVSTATMADWILRKLDPKQPGMSIDRIDTNGHYEPGNLRWATLGEQMKNRNSWRRGT